MMLAFAIVATVAIVAIIGYDPEERPLLENIHLLARGIGRDSWGGLYQ